MAKATKTDVLFIQATIPDTRGRNIISMIFIYIRHYVLLIYMVFFGNLFKVWPNYETNVTKNFLSDT